jgi:thioredoxin 1
MSRKETHYSTFRKMAPKEEKSSYTMLEVQHLQHRKKILDENSIVCIYISATWCTPCKVIGPQVANLAQRYNNSTECIIVKEDSDLQLTRDCQIGGIPAFIFYRNRLLLKNKDNSPIMVVGGDLQQVQDILDKLTGRR